MLVSRLILGFVAAASTVGCLAQDDLSIGSVVDSEQIKQMLESDNPRLVAWGAYFASRSQDAVSSPVFVTLMERKMGQWGAQSERTRHRDVDDAIHENVIRERRKAIQAILYALIEEGASVPIGSLIPNAADFSTETLILAARLPTDELSPFLRDWCDKNRWRATAEENWHYTAACTPVAAMLLAKDPPPGFAANLLNEPHEELSFWVMDTDGDVSKMRSREEGGGDPACRDKKAKEDQTLSPPPERLEAVERELAQWPPPFTYLLQSSASPYPGTSLVDAGGLAVAYREIPVFTRPTGCYPPPIQFSEDVLHHLLAEMLEVGDETIPWSAHRDVAFSLRNPADFLPALNKQIKLEQSEFREMVQALEDKGHLTKDEAAKLSLKLMVTVNDARVTVFTGQSRPRPPLPVFVSKDPLISVGYDER